jgi:hypothetical protein
MYFTDIWEKINILTEFGRIDKPLPVEVITAGDRVPRSGLHAVRGTISNGLRHVFASVGRVEVTGSHSPTLLRHSAALFGEDINFKHHAATMFSRPRSS